MLRFVRLVIKTRKQNLKYGKLTAKKAEAIPWDILLVDLICPYEVTREGPGETITLEALDTIESATGWIEIVQYNDNQAAII